MIFGLNYFIKYKPNVLEYYWLCRLAISMYEKFGYVKYRRVLGYYSGDDPEDAWDMRKALPRDKEKKSIIPMDRPILPSELEW